MFHDAKITYIFEEKAITSVFFDNFARDFKYLKILH